MASREIPKTPSLEFDRKRSKRLLAAARRGDPGVLALFSAHHPRFAGVAPEAWMKAVALHDAELVVAREYGFSSWPLWKRFVEARLATRAEQAALLVRAACSNDLERARALLAADPSLAGFDLFTACACGDVESVQRELDAGADALGPGGPSGWAPILYACFSRFLRRDARRAAGIVLVVRTLLARGADPNAQYLSAAGEHGPGEAQTCLYGAAGIANHAELTRLLLEAGADVNEGAPDPGSGYQQLGTEALYHASEFRSTDCLRLLLEARPHPRRVSYCLGRVLDFDNEAGALLYLEQGADPNFMVPWHNRQTHLHKAVRHRRSTPTLAALLAHGADPNFPDAHGVSPYRYAIRRGSVEIAHLLEAHGARTESVTSDDRALGQIASGTAGAGAVGRAFDRGLLAWAARREDLALVVRLLDAGADIDAGEDMPPLHNACYAGRRAAVQLLLARGADLHRKNAYGGDALQSALYGSIDCCDPEGGPGSLTPEEITHGDFAGIVQVLLEAGAQPPSRVSGSEAVREALRRHGVPDLD
jgi:ankyrin repeat protein